MSTRGNYMKMPTHSRANKSKRIKWNKIPTVLCVCVCHPLSGWLKWACPFCKHMLQQLHVAPAQKQSNRIESGLIPLNEMTILFSCKSHRAPKWPAWIKARECSSVCMCMCMWVWVGVCVCSLLSQPGRGIADIACTARSATNRSSLLCLATSRHRIWGDPRPASCLCSVLCLS